MDLNQDQVKQLAKRSQKQTLENNFHTAWALEFPMLPEPVRQHPITNPKTGRCWRLDFAWVPEKLAVEIQGGSYLPKGGHNTAAGQAKDYERHNTLTRLGWRILYFNTPLLKHMVDVVTEVAEMLCSSQEIDNGQPGSKVDR